MRNVVKNMLVRKYIYRMRREREREIGIRGGVEIGGEGMRRYIEKRR